MLSKLTRKLRKKQTLSESIFWNHVRNRKLGVKINRQYAFKFLYKGCWKLYVADFYCAKWRLVIEIDGGIHVSRKQYDMERTEALESIGLKVIRFWNEEVDDIEKVKSRIYSNLASLYLERGISGAL
jgi:very-short-patch-repair endonuclease